METILLLGDKYSGVRIPAGGPFALLMEFSLRNSNSSQLQYDSPYGFQPLIKLLSNLYL